MGLWRKVNFHSNFGSCTGFFGTLGGVQALVSFCPTLPRTLTSYDRSQNCDVVPFLWTSLSVTASVCFCWDLTIVKWLRMCCILISEHWFSETPHLEWWMVRNAGSDHGCSGTGKIVFFSCYHRSYNWNLKCCLLEVLGLFFSFKGTLPFINKGNNLFY